MILKIKSRQLLSIITIISLGFFVNCGSTATSSDAAADDPAAEDPASDTLQVTVTGQVAVRASDVAASLAAPSLTKGLSKTIKPKFTTIGDTILADATVTLVKMNADGTEETVTTTTTDAEGNYTLAQVDVCQAATGAEDDYYYEMRVTSGDTTVKAPLCPDGATEEVTADVSPESTIAADVISDVADVPGADNNAVPPADEFEKVTDLVSNNVTELGSDIEVPALTDATAVLALANGISAAGGDAENSYKAFQFASENVELTTSDTATTEEMAGYMVRVAREACDQPSTTPLSEAAAEALADALDADTTYTPTDVVNAYIEASGDQAASVATEVSEYAAILEDIEGVTAEANLSSLIKKAELISDITQVALYTEGDLSSDTLSDTTELTADQALTFLMSIPETPCAFQGLDITKVIASLTDATALATPEIAEVEIYNDSGFNCNGAGLGHFIGNVTMYLPTGSPLTVTSVAITSTDPASLGGDGAITLTSSGGRYVSQVDANNPPNPGDCVTIDEEVTYTITATLSDASTVTKEVTRTHPSVPEADATLDGAVLSGNSNSPTVVSVARPTFTWDSPDDVLAQIPTAPSGTQIKYKYEYAHFKQGDGGPINSNAFPACPAVSFGPFYSVDNFIPTTDCDVDACATAESTTPDQIMCRLSVQTYLVDETDDIVAQAAGDFKFFCVDTNDDSDCGE